MLPTLSSQTLTNTLQTKKCGNVLKYLRMFGSFLQPQLKRLFVKIRKMVKVHKIVPIDDLQYSDLLHMRKSAACSYRESDNSIPRNFITFL